jgi:hypothetical protein
MRNLLNYFFIILLIINTFSIVSYNAENLKQIEIGKNDNKYITINFSSIRSLDQIDKLSDPDFYLKIIYDNQEFISKIWNNTEYIYDTNFSPIINVSNDLEEIKIIIQLWDYADENDCDRLCDLNGNIENYDIEIIYNLNTGHWRGDDYLIKNNVNYDPSGYGRLNGCDDGTIYQIDRDCELWFDIYQNDIDMDRIPDWIETNLYGTEPDINNNGEDVDGDGIPIEWEHKWGYDPNVWDDHYNLDIDNDSISNIEEYNTSNSLSDPFRKDIFLEIDYMDFSPDGAKSIIPEKSKDLMKNPFHKRNIVFHVDIGEKYGGDIIPYDEKTDLEELKDISYNYFIDNEETRWKRGVFHYGVIVYKSFPAGFAFSLDVPPFWGYHPGTNCFTVSSSLITELKQKFDLYKPKELDYLFASAIVHEMGHNFGIKSGNPYGCDVQLSKYPWQIGWWIYRNYKSIMNYHYTYEILDYSNGSHGKRDYDDWSNIDLGYFEFQ